MKLRYLYLGFDNLNERYYSDKKRFAYNFTSNYRFIANYLSKTIRKYKIENNIGVNMLYIRLTPEDSHIKVKEYSHVLEVYCYYFSLVFPLYSIAYLEEMYQYFLNK